MAPTPAAARYTYSVWNVTAPDGRPTGPARIEAEGTYMVHAAKPFVGNLTANAVAQFLHQVFSADDWEIVRLEVAPNPAPGRSQITAWVVNRQPAKRAGHDTDDPNAPGNLTEDDLAALHELEVV